MRVLQLSEQTLLARAHAHIYAFHEWHYFQLTMIMLICANFILNILDFEFHPQDGSRMRDMIDSIDFALTCIFVAEILINAMAHWFWPFVTDPWNIFDVVIIGDFLVLVLFYALIPLDYWFCLNLP